MSDRVSYSYVVLRYVHDTVTGEFVNVGVALLAPEARFLSAICRTTYQRLSTTFPGLRPAHFRSQMRHIQSRFESMGDAFGDSTSEERSLSTIARSVLPSDDSTLQWGTVGTGRTQDPARTLETLFERMVTRYDQPQPGKARRSDDDVWRHFKRDLEQRRVLRFFAPKTIHAADDEVRFEHAWRNGVWHCLEPVSLDLAAADSIRDKAHKLLGQFTSVRASAEPFKLYMLVGRPSDESLTPAYDNAMSILSKMPVDKEILVVEQHAWLAERLANEVETHFGVTRIGADSTAIALTGPSDPLEGKPSLLPYRRGD